jgi:exopolyphosphatase/guanosine-5'-triphosphate,3'-diphosphate pyrophosphatase
MNIAVIDCGTNTFNIALRDTHDHRLIYSNKISVRLAEGRDVDRNLSQAAIARAMAALQTHKESALGYGAEALYVLATSAIRSAPNRATLLNAASEQLGLQIRLIDGLEEADLIFEGVAQGVKLQNATTLVMDIGGGSTELILVRDQKPVWRNSYPLGSSALLNQFRPGDTILQEELDALDEHYAEQLADLKEQCQNDFPRVLIGSSGSFDTLANMCVANFESSRLEEEDTSYTFIIHEYMKIADQMIRSTFEERLNTPGMDPMRADLMVMACTQINFIIKRFGIKMMQQCRYAVKEGAYFSIQKNPELWPKSSL